MPEVTVPIERLPHGADLPLPGYASDGAAGLDLLAAVDATLRLEPMARTLVPTGIRLALPEGLEAQIRPGDGDLTGANTEKTAELYHGCFHVTARIGKQVDDPTNILFVAAADLNA